MSTERGNGGAGRREELGGKLSSMRHGVGGEETTHVTRGARGQSLTGWSAGERGGYINFLLWVKAFGYHERS